MFLVFIYSSGALLERVRRPDPCARGAILSINCLRWRIIFSIRGGSAHAFLVAVSLVLAESVAFVVERGTARRRPQRSRQFRVGPSTRRARFGRSAPRAASVGIERDTRSLVTGTSLHTPLSSWMKTTTLGRYPQSCSWGYSRDRPRCA